MDLATAQAMRRRTVIFAIIAALWCAGPCRLSIATQAPGFSGAVDSIIDGTVANNRLPSICVAIGRRGKVIYTHCAGQINLAKNLPATPSTIYQIGSVTKQFTTAALMLLANQKPPAVALNAPVA